MDALIPENPDSCLDEETREKLWSEYIDTDLSISLAVQVEPEDRDELPVFMETIAEAFNIG